MPRGPSSRAMLCAMNLKPPLAAAKAAKCARPLVLPEAPVKMTLPRPRGSMARAASRPTRNPLRQLWRQTFSKSAAESSVNGPCTRVAATNATASTGAIVLSICWKSFATSVSLVRSAGKEEGPSCRARMESRSGLRAASATAYPSRAKRIATDFPSPGPAPATSKVFAMSAVMYMHVPRAALPRRTRAARQPAVPAGLGAGAPELHAQDAEYAEPRRVRAARLGRRLAPAREAVLLRLAVAAGVRPQSQEPRRESARGLRAGARAGCRLFGGGGNLAAERAPVPVRRRAVGARAQRRPRRHGSAEAAPRAAPPAAVPRRHPRHDRQRMDLRALHVAAFRPGRHRR